MKIALVGYGRMGKAIYALSKNSKDSVVAIIDSFSNDKEVTAINISESSLKHADVVIDFSSPNSAVDNIKKYAELHLPAVIGTTGWYDRIDEVEKILSDNSSKAVYSGNFSLGVAIFSRIVKYASHLFNKIPLYDVTLREVHHKEKADSPSGTALMLAERILSEMDRKDTLLIGNSEGKIKPNELQVVSERVGYFSGMHEAIFDSPADTVTLTHTARTRDGFAFGALRAATWISRTKKTGLLKMDDFLKELF